MDLRNRLIREIKVKWKVKEITIYLIFIKIVLVRN